MAIDAALARTLSVIRCHHAKTMAQRPCLNCARAAASDVRTQGATLIRQAARTVVRLEGFDCEPTPLDYAYAVQLLKELTPHILAARRKGFQSMPLADHCPNDLPPADVTPGAEPGKPCEPIPCPADPVQEWTAVLAPLDAPSADGRRLSARFKIVATRFPVPLLEDSPQARIIGTVGGVDIRDGQVTAHGTVDDPFVAARMATGELRPQMSLAGYGEELGALVSASLREVRAGTRPVWPVCRFTLTPAPIPGAPSKPLPEFRRTGPHPPTPQDMDAFAVLVVEADREGGGVHFAKGVIFAGAPQHLIEEEFQKLERDLTAHIRKGTPPCTTP